MRVVYLLLAKEMKRSDLFGLFTLVPHVIVHVGKKTTLNCKEINKKQFHNFSKEITAFKRRKEVEDCHFLKGHDIKMLRILFYSTLYHIFMESFPIFGFTGPNLP